MRISFDRKPYIAVVGNIRHSRKLQDSSAVRYRLKQVLDNINFLYRSDIAANFNITIGDEFQGLLIPGASAVYIIDRIERKMHPARLRFGIGVGEITTDVDTNELAEADGPAFDLARETMDALKAAEREKKEPRNNTAVKLQGHAELSAVMTTIFSLLSAVKEGWTARQAEIVNAYLDWGKQTDAARMLRINQSNVQRALAAAKYYTYRNALDIVAGLLSDLREADHA